MPFERNADLPEAVRRDLSEAAQTVYREAFNRAWILYGEAENRHPAASRETTAHRVARSAVAAPPAGG